MSEEQDVVLLVLLVRDRSGACTDQIVAALEHHAIDLRAGRRVIGPRHINSFNGYHRRLKNWLRRFKGVASSYLHHDLGLFRALERFNPVHLTPSALLALAIGI
jgi:hypothetical protein